MVLADDPTSLIHIVLTGSTLPGVKNAPTTVVMPGFGWRLDDHQVADVVNFIRTSWGNKGEKPVTAADVADVRKETFVQQQGDVDIENRRRPNINRRGRRAA